MKRKHNTWYVSQSLCQTICTNDNFAIVEKMPITTYAWLFLGLFMNLFQQRASLRRTAQENQHSHSHFCLAKYFAVFPKHFT